MMNPIRTFQPVVSISYMAFNGECTRTRVGRKDFAKRLASTSTLSSLNIRVVDEVTSPSTTPNPKIELLQSTSQL